MRPIYLTFLILSLFSIGLRSQNIFNNYRPDRGETEKIFNKSRINYYLNSSHLNDTDFEGILRRGIANMQNGMYDTAIRYFRKLIFEEDENNLNNTISNKRWQPAEPFFYIGLCKAVQLENDSAEYYLRKATEIDPLHAEAWMELGSLMAHKGDFKSGISYLEKALEMDPNSVMAQYNIGILYALNDDIKKSLKHLKQAVKTDPSFELGHIGLGFVQILKDKTARARKHFKDALEANPKSFAAYYLMAVTYYSDSRFKKAYEYLEKSYQQDTSFYYLLAVMSGINIYYDEYELAIKHLLKTLNSLQKDYSLFNRNGYEVLEMYDLLKLINEKNQLTEEEVQLGYEFLKKTHDGKHYLFEKLLQDFLKDNPESIFARRIQLYTSHEIWSYRKTESRREKMKEQLNQLLELKGDFLNGKILKAELLYQEEKYLESGKFFYEILAEKPAYSYAHFHLGKFFSYKGLYHKALPHYDKAIANGKFYTEAYLERAYTHGNRGKHRKSLNDFIKVLSIDPSQNHIINDIGVCYENLNLDDSAMYYYDLSLQVEPENPVVLCNRGRLYYSLDSLDKALSDLNQSINIYKYRSLAYASRGMVLHAQRKFEEAIEDYNQAIKLDFYVGWYYEKRGDTYMELKLYENAAKDFERCLTINRHSYYTLKRLGDAYRFKQEFKKALENYQKSYRLNPNYKFTPYCIGICMASLGNYDDAVGWMEIAVKIDSSYCFAYENLGLMHYTLGNYNKSLDYAEKAVALNEQRVLALFNIPLIYLVSGSPEDARELYVEAVEKVRAMDQEIPAAAIDVLKDIQKQGFLQKEIEEILTNVLQKQSPPQKVTGLH